MISYLNEQPRTQALADALRGTAASSGGTQMPAATPMPGSASTPPPPPDFNQYGNGAEGGGADLGSALKGGFNMFKNSDTGKDMMSSISSMFGGGMPSGMGGFGAGSGAGWTGGLSSGGPALGGGGTLTGGGGSAMDAFGPGTGAGWTGGLDSGGPALGGGGGMSGGSWMAMADNLFGDKLYGKQKGNDETSQTGDAARSALTTAAYSNPYSAAALWADRLLLDGKGMDTLTGWLD